MDFSPEQTKAIDAVASWLRDPSAPQVYRLFGYAGTGKTTLAKHLALNGDMQSTFAAYTGKAASVLRRKGCPNASTIHGLIYTVAQVDKRTLDELKLRVAETQGVEREEAIKKFEEAKRPKFILKEDALESLDFVVIDECSMVGKEIGEDLLSFGKKILVLGDPGQLPPIEGGGFFTEGTPDYLLSEVHRQAQGSPVINLATLVRKGHSPKPGAYGDSKVQSRFKTEPTQLVGASQVIVGTNKTRASFNSIVRDQWGYIGSVPLEDEKLICLRNNHEEGFLNGTQWGVESVKDEGAYITCDLHNWDDATESKKNVKIHHFDVNLKDMYYWDRKRANEFTFGYAITCHKSQGSQWEDVFIQNESFIFKENSARWLYTAITRAESKVVIAQ